MTENHFKKSLLVARLWHALGFFVIAGCAVLGAWLSADSNLRRDITGAQSHTLRPASRAALDELAAPLAITAYLPSAHPWRAQIEHLAARYTRDRANVSFRIIDPASAPENVRSQEIRGGEILLSSGQRTERTATYSEQSLSEAIMRLTRSTTSWVAFVTGHGERSPRRGANHDFSEFATTLEKRGIKIQELDLAAIGQIPENTSLLVLASPRLDYLPGEISAITDYIDAGGNLIAFLEPELPPTLVALLERFGIHTLKGTVIDPTSLAHGIDDPSVVLVKNYLDHPIFDNFDLTTLMFHAVAVYASVSDAAGFEAQVLGETSAQAWNETDIEAGQVAHDETHESKAVLPLAQVLSRNVAGIEQRVVVFGDGDFLANTYLHNSGNQDLGVRSIEWLLEAGALIDIPVRVADDQRFELEAWQQATIGGFFLFVLPAALALNGGLIWWRRRRA